MAKRLSVTNAGDQNLTRETFSISNFIAGGLTHITSKEIHNLKSLSITSGEHKHPAMSVPKVKKQEDHHHHRHHHHHRPHHVVDDKEELLPLSHEQQMEFHTIGHHVEQLKKMHPQLRQLVYQKMHHLCVKKGNLVILQGEDSDAWYIVLRGSLQCVVDQRKSAAVPSSNNYQFDKMAAERRNSEKASEEVTYYFGHGQRVKGLSVGVFNPGDSFGESIFEHAKRQVERTLRGNNAQHDHHHHHDNEPTPPLPKRAASVIALEDADLLKVTLADFVEMQTSFRRHVLNETFECLRVLPIFQDLNDNELEMLCRHCTVHHLKRNKIILKPNQALSCFVVKKGCARVLLQEGNAFLELASIGVGNIFGGARLSQGCTRAGKGVALITSETIVENEIIEINPVHFLRYCIRQDKTRRQRWCRSLDESCRSLDDLPKCLEQDRKWVKFKSNLMENLEKDAADDTMLPAAFRERVCAPGTRYSAEGRRRMTQHRKRNQNIQTVDSNELLKHATRIQTRKGAALHDFVLKMKESAKQAGKKYSTLTREAAQAISEATDTPPAETRVCEPELVMKKESSSTTNVVRNHKQALKLWWEKTAPVVVAAMHMPIDGRSGRASQSPLRNRTMKGTPNLSSRSVGSVMGGRSSPKRPSTTTFRPCRQKNSEEEKHPFGKRWVPTRRVTEEISTGEFKGRKSVSTGNWHANYF